MDTLRSIADGMEHKYPNHTRYRGGQLETFCGGGDCPKCRLEALLSEYEKVDLVKTWRGQVGSDTYENSVDCGNAGDVYSAGCNETLRENSDELETWLAVNLERIKAEARLEGEISEHKRTCQMYWHVCRGNDARCSEGYTCERLAALEAQAKEKP